MASSYIRWQPDIDSQLFSRGHARQLGHLENYFVVCQRQRLYTNFSMYCELESEDNSTITLEDIARALRYTVFQNPILLSVLIEKYDDKTIYSNKEFLNTIYHDDFDYMKVIENLDLIDVLINLQPEYQKFNELASKIIGGTNKQGGLAANDVENRLMELMNTLKITYNDVTKPHWRLYWIENTNRFFVLTNHIGFDGISLVNFCKDFCAGFNHLDLHNNQSQNGMNIFDYKRDFQTLNPFPLPAEKLLDYKFSLLGMPRFIVSEIVKKQLVQLNDSAAIEQIEFKDMMASNLHDVFVNKTISTEKVSLILEKCRALKIKMTPMLQACWLKANDEMKTFENRRWFEWFTEIVVTSDARFLVKNFDQDTLPNVKIGSLMAGSNYPYSINEIKTKNLVGLCQSYNKSFETARKKGHYIEGLGVFMKPFVYDNNNIDKMQLDRHIFPHSCKRGTMIGNLGSFDFASSKDCLNSSLNPIPNITEHNVKKIKDMKFVQGTASFTKSYLLNIISNSKTGMNITFSADKRVFANEDDGNTDFFNTLIATFLEKINEFVSTV